MNAHEREDLASDVLSLSTAAMLLLGVVVTILNVLSFVFGGRR